MKRFLPSLYLAQSDAKMIEGPVLQKPLKTSFRELWRHSPLWRFTLLGTGIAAAIFLIYPPWQGDEPQRVKPLLSTPKTATVIHGSDSDASSVASPVSKVITPAIMVTSPAEKSTVDPQPEAKSILAYHATGHASESSPHIMVRPQEMKEENSVPESSPIVVPSAPPPATAESPRGISGQIVEADQNCNGAGPLLSPLNAPLPVPGQIISFMPPSQAMAMIPKSERLANGKIDPQYVQNQRVLIHPDGAPAYARILALIPMGMHAYVGEQVRFVGGHASPNLSCHYIPNLVMEESPQ